MRKPVRIAISAAAVLVAGAIVAVVLYEWKAASERQNVSEVEAQITQALPMGSSASAIKEYLREQGLPYREFVVSENDSLDTFLELSEIGVGARVIYAQQSQNNSLIGLGPRMIEIIFLLKDDDTLDRFFVYGHDPI